ncbi:type IV pilus assembly protein PilM [Sedimentibacter acidaminivorans]|uniref:Type IV pilus assembly protein PilM n=1 Tax=Sedimentibacter acidaminivorans TaxID=913099 RepID=A0ABS4GI18_9FIRM|nr:pilus assembly protein PilM [Sedimentibacter acidaminivorans]MBP1927331.1 type IV pilus assembly protein PilM [Sedimentibacter acidaminivorans]
MDLFNKKMTISIEFCSDEVKVVEGRYNKKNIIINKSFSIPVPDGLYVDGVIKDMEQFSYVLQNGLSKNNISHGEVFGVINSSNIIIREIRIPKVEESKIASILKYQLDEYLPVDPEGYVVQYIPLDIVDEEGVEKQNIMLVGVPKFMVETHLNLLNNLGLKPVVLDYAGNAIRKLISFSDNINDAYDNGITIACVDLEQESTALNITHKGLMSMSRVVKAEISAVDDEESPFKTLDESYDQDVAVISSIKSNLAVVLDGIDMVFRYYNSREADNDIELVLIYGSYSDIDGIESLMSNYLNRQCIKLNSLDKVKFNGDLSKYANAIGALIRVNGVK